MANWPMIMVWLYTKKKPELFPFEACCNYFLVEVTIADSATTPRSLREFMERKMCLSWLLLYWLNPTQLNHMILATSEQAILQYRLPNDEI